MLVEISGSVRLLGYEGVWPLKRKKWREHPFSWKFDTEDGSLGVLHELAEHFKVAVDLEKEMVIVRARLRGVKFVLGESALGTDRHINLSVQQVARAEVRGDLYFKNSLR